MIELLVASYIGIKPYIPSTPSVDFVVVESEITKREQEESKEQTRGTSFTGGEAKLLYQDNTNNCVLWAKKQTGINKTLGNGARTAVEVSEARIGSIGALKGQIPHAVVVVAISGDSITFHESNFYKGWITERTLPRSSFIGFVY